MARPLQLAAIVFCGLTTLVGAQELRVNGKQLVLNEGLKGQELRVQIDLGEQGEATVEASDGEVTASDVLTKGEIHVLRAELKLLGSGSTAAERLQQIVSLIGHRALKRPSVVEGRLDYLPQDDENGMRNGRYLNGEHFLTLFTLSGRAWYQEEQDVLRDMQGMNVRVKRVLTIPEATVPPVGMHHDSLNGWVPLYTLWPQRKFALARVLEQPLFEEEETDISGQIVDRHLLTAAGERVRLVGLNAEWLSRELPNRRLTVRGAFLRGVERTDKVRLLAVRAFRARIREWSMLEPSSQFEFAEPVWPACEAWVMRKRYFPKGGAFYRLGSGYLYLENSLVDGWIPVERLEFLEPEPVQPEQSGLNDVFSTD